MSSFRDKFPQRGRAAGRTTSSSWRKGTHAGGFFHTFNALHESMKQIVIASERAAEELPRSRTGCAAVSSGAFDCRHSAADLETKIAILQKKGQQEKSRCPPTVALYVASNIRSNVREPKARCRPWLPIHR